MGTLYILQSMVNGRYYIGSTNNLTRRLGEHNSGKSIYTNLTKPFGLVFSKNYSTLEEARSIEYKLKRFKSRKIIEQIIKEEDVKLNGRLAQR